MRRVEARQLQTGLEFLPKRDYGSLARGLKDRLHDIQSLASDVDTRPNALDASRFSLIRRSSHYWVERFKKSISKRLAAIKAGGVGDVGGEAGNTGDEGDKNDSDGDGGFTEGDRGHSHDHDHDYDGFDNHDHHGHDDNDYDGGYDGDNDGDGDGGSDDDGGSEGDF